MKQELQTHLISTEIVEAIEKLAEQEGKEVIDLATELLEDGLNLTHPSPVLLSVFLLGFMCTGLAYMGYVVLIKRVGPVRASTVVLIVPISGMLWANIFLNEAITLTMLLGCFFILTGVGLVNFFKDEVSD